MKKTPVKTNPQKEVEIEKILQTCGFKKIESEGISIHVNSQEGEIDGIYIYENIIILLEITSTKNVTEHFIKKKHIHEIITSENLREESFKEISDKIPDFDMEIRKNNKFSIDDYKIISLYYSEKRDLPESIIKNKGDFIIINYQEALYFESLCKSIERSTLYELLSFLRIKEQDINPQHLNGGLSNIKRFEAFTIAKSIVSPDNSFILISFYISPNTLLKQSYILRRRGWRDDPKAYQRLIRREKISEMRDYIFNKGGVYLNNIIITLPEETEISCVKSGEKLNKDNITHLKKIIISIPEEFGNIGIIDGQHRIFSYHHENNICEKNESIRNKPSILATAILFTSKTTEEKRKIKEAEIFWKINSTQSKVEDSLKQELESILNPLSNISIARSILNKLIKNTNLSNYVEKTSQPEIGKIKTSSLIRYAITPSIKSPINRGNNKKTLFDSWKKKSGNQEINLENLEDYIDYCFNIAKKCLEAANKRLGKKWKVRSRLDKDGVLSPTTLGGFFLYLQEMVNQDINPEEIDFYSVFENIELVEFSKYSSSKWAAYARELQEHCPPMDPNTVS